MAADRNPRLIHRSQASLVRWYFFFAGMFVCGLFSLQPGQAKVCVLFGKYIGTVKDEGPSLATYYAKTLLSTNVGNLPLLQRAMAPQQSVCTLPSFPLVHVRRMATSSRSTTAWATQSTEVVVWRVSTYRKGPFDVDDYDGYVAMQAETAPAQARRQHLQLRPHGGRV